MTQSEADKVQEVIKNAIESVTRNGENIGWGILAKNAYFSSLFKVISPRMEKVFEFRYGLNDGITKTLEETAQEFGVTRERIRQMESKAFEQILQAIELGVEKVTMNREAQERLKNGEPIS